MNKTDILLTLGETKFSNTGDWPDYLQHGFDQTDVPDLINLVRDEALHNADNESFEAWAPLHAWRTLGQLRSEKAVIPLINIFDVMIENDDDWALAELPKVMGMIGQSAIKPLAAFMNGKDHLEFARAIAADGLSEIVKDHPALRDDVLKYYQNYLKQPDVTVDTFNGLLVCCLLDHEAKELINEIRDLFKQGCVDLSCAGDIEDIEIALGFRDKRETPKLTFSEMHKLPPIEDEELEECEDMIDILEHYLDQHGHDDSILNVSELDGFFAALACSPHLIVPSVWLSAIWGGEALSPEWESEKEFQEFSNAVFAVYNHVMTSMNVNEYEALFLIREVKGKTYTIVDEWCEGFLKGINLWEPLAATDAIVVEKALEPVRLFATEPGFEILEPLTEKEIGKHQKTIEPSVRELFEHFYKHRSMINEPVIRSEPKIGRNDPCPCGSGKKYKKCCLH